MTPSASPLVTAPHPQPENGVSLTCSRAQFERVVQTALEQAQKLGVSAAAAAASESAGLNVSVRLGQLEQVEHNRDKSLQVTVYLGQQTGHASTSDFDPDAIARTVQAACDIARYTGADPCAGLPEPDTLVDPVQARRDLHLFYPWSLSTEDACEQALATEAAAIGCDARISNSEGASTSAQQRHFYSAHWQDGTVVFEGGFASSRYGYSVAPIAADARGMQRDFWYSDKRNPAELADPASIGRYAAARALSRLGATPCKTAQCPVLFESHLAAGLIGAVVQALGGSAQYRKSTFLLDSVGRFVLPEHISLKEDPFIPAALGSTPFDDEGVRVQPTTIIAAGCVQHYFLSSYSARKLGLATTGHAGGAHNLAWASTQTLATDDLNAMIKKLHRGLFVTELMGSGVNPVTGDYSRGASGFWVEHGAIAYPVQEVTIAGNMRDMLKNIAAIGADRYTYGAKTTGSVLIDQMTVAGT